MAPAGDGDIAELKRQARALVTRPDGARAWLDRELIALSIAPVGHQSSFRAHRDAGGIGLLLNDGPSIRVTADVRYPVDRPIARVTAPGRLTCLRIVRGGGAALSLWRTPSTADGGPAHPLGDVPLTDGAVVMLDGRVRAWAIVGTRTAVVTLNATILAYRAATIRQYDCKDGRLLRAATLDAGAARAELLAGVLRATHHPDTGRLLGQATHDPAHFLRWSAMREWLRHDRAAALPRLREMAMTDEDADVRRAAQATIMRLPDPEAISCRA